MGLSGPLILCPFPSKELGDGDIFCYIMLPRVAAGCSVIHVGSYWFYKCYIYIYIIFAMLIHLFVSFSFSVVMQCYSHYSLIPRSSPCPGEKQEQPGAPDQTT